MVVSLSIAASIHSIQIRSRGKLLYCLRKGDSFNVHGMSSKLMPHIMCLTCVFQYLNILRIFFLKLAIIVFCASTSVSQVLLSQLFIPTPTYPPLPCFIASYTTQTLACLVEELWAWLLLHLRYEGLFPHMAIRRAIRHHLSGIVYSQLL